MPDSDGYTGLGEEFPVDHRYIDRFFRRYTLEGQARQTALALLEDANRFRWCGARSFRHANQFDKVVLGMSRNNGRKLVWHRWHYAGGGTAPEVHNHRWNFVSYLLSGSIQTTDYQVDQAGGEPAYRRYRYRSPGDEQQYVMSYVGMAGLHPAAERVYNAGEFYFQPHRIIHSAKAGEPGSSTLIVQGEVTAKTTDVFIEAGTGAATHVERQVHRFGESELKGLLEELAGQLTAGVTR